MELNILDWSFISISNLDSKECNIESKHNTKTYLNLKDIPSLLQIPKIKKRRLSTFSQLTLAAALETSPDKQIPTVFSSRHGDLHKTTQLLKEVSKDESISPTQFGLSVHNAISGQFGVLTGNQAASSVIAGGINSFHYGLIEANTLLLEHEEVLVVHSDMELPLEYSQFKDEQQVSHSFAILLSRCSEKGANYKLSSISVSADTKTNDNKPQSIEFYEFLSNDNQSTVIFNQWAWDKLNVVN